MKNLMNKEKSMDKQTIKNLIDMIREYYYERNGKEDSIGFLEFMIRSLKDTDEVLWEELKKESIDDWCEE